MTDLIERAMRLAARLNQSVDGCDNYDGATIDKLLDHVEALEAQLAEARDEPARIVNIIIQAIKSVPRDDYDMIDEVLEACNNALAQVGGAFEHDDPA